MRQKKSIDCLRLATPPHSLKLRRRVHAQRLSHSVNVLTMQRQRCSTAWHCNLGDIQRNNDAKCAYLSYVHVTTRQLVPTLSLYII